MSLDSEMARITAPAKDRAPFIATQGLRLLDKLADPWRLLHPAKFRAGRPAVPAGKIGMGIWREQDPDASDWKPAHRTRLFLDPCYHRLVLTTDAGIGKTTMLAWAEQAIAASARGELAFRLPAADLPESIDGYPLPNDESQPRGFVQMLRNAPGNERLRDGAGKHLLVRLLQQGRLVLLIDALDQLSVAGTGGDPGQDPRIKALRTFLRSAAAQSCRVVIAGRPYSLHKFREAIFEGDIWRFAQLDQFTSDQQRQYLGDERFGHLERLDMEILSIPRALEVLRKLSPAELDKLQTASDVYWACAQHLLEKGLTTELKRQGFTLRKAVWLLGALAFEMVRERNFEGVDEGAFPAFSQRVWEQQENNRSKRFADEDNYTTGLDQLGTMNEMIDHGFVEGWGLKQVFWRNRTLQEFFAAYWLVNFASDEDATWMGHAEHLYLPDHKRSEELYWVWRFASEMPPPARDPDKWVAAVKSLYRPGDGTKEGTRRSTEMIYRSWRTANQAESANLEAQRKLYHLFVADVLTPYQAEFETEIRIGKRDALARTIANEFLNGFRRCPPPKEDGSSGALTFWFGSLEYEYGGIGETEPLQHQAAVDSPFELTEFPVTAEQYELYDPAYQRYTWPRVPVPSDCLFPPPDYRWPNCFTPNDKCPAVEVSWYDAVAFCLWLGKRFRLPNEKEWEFACRAGTRTAFWFGDDDCRLSVHAWTRYPHGDTDAFCAFDRRLDTHRNPWGLYDMHGNVWEWCGEWYDGGEYAPYFPSRPPGGQQRVVRGGTWLNGESDPAEVCRSASRNYRQADDRELHVGFRVARTCRP